MAMGRGCKIEWALTGTWVFSSAKVTQWLVTSYGPSPALRELGERLILPGFRVVADKWTQPHIWILRGSPLEKMRLEPS